MENTSILLSLLKRLSTEKVSNTDRAVALIWAHSLNENTGISIKDICSHFVQSGYAKQNGTLLNRRLTSDRRTAKAGVNCYRINARLNSSVEKQFKKYLKPTIQERSELFISESIFKNARGYTQKVVAQINASYEYGLCDCCAVMCRRLLETLIIESYEKKGIESLIKGSDGHFFMFSSLLNHLEKTEALNLGRSSLAALKKFKTLGDLSAFLFVLLFTIFTNMTAN